MGETDGQLFKPVINFPFVLLLAKRIPPHCRSHKYPPHTTYAFGQFGRYLS